MNAFKKLVATVAAASAVGATLTACGSQNTLVEAADKVRKKAHCEAVESFSDWDDGDFKFLRGERYFQEVRDQTWAMYITASEKDKEKLKPAIDTFYRELDQLEEISQTEDLWEGTLGLLGWYGTQKVRDQPIGHAYVELIDYADNNRCDTVYYR
ncbi:hypothetical protein LA324_04345 [Corynebacterium coyleae]|uniref:hypothetical protein n=1 Tax=Corynebacterium coyleae TaxID=53374 RepID=UPI001CC92377|nr:hypothetical protein [Corynebacterium coyleae]UBI09852.1 hypothetical protein LA324_04345 [Corynebacterium coyleae]